jgi:hypothetical protein
MPTRIDMSAYVHVSGMVNFDGDASYANVYIRTRTRVCFLFLACALLICCWPGHGHICT